MNKHNLIAVDLAKNIFQVCIVNDKNHVLKNRKLNRSRVSEFIAKQPPSIVAMEACYSSHFWARLFQSFGHQVMLLPAQHVKPFVRGNKNDHNDALAIAEAAARPNIKSVPIKTEAQQDIQALHRLRERIVAQRTGLSSQVRGLLSEYGIVFPNGFKALRCALGELLDPDDARLSIALKIQLQSITDEFEYLCGRLKKLNQSLAQIDQENPQCQNLMSIPGIGYVNATALFSAIGNGSQFKNSREFSVWLGLTPKHFGSGEKQTTGSITKRGNRYLRKQLIHGARAVMSRCKKRNDNFSRWINNLVARRGPNKACVALANKMARICLALLHKNTMYQSR